MSDEGDRTCPLCAEEMDLTDQQLKPCKCGYEICVWCWHHIMDMAEKDETEGRCPACRTPYNKERIVGMAASCEKLVAEWNIEKKQKHKGKNKTSEGRKQLSSVRVIQRNLVYIVGLPLNLADEDLLQRKEYFAQYGRVLKVSISRTAAGAIQHFANNTCSVYITYSKEDEAIRCIQSVHGFVLDGRPLRACFGTTKYCHAWLRNVPCSNPDCLYLHEIGSQEDSFTKDEIISAYTRSRVQQSMGATNSMQRRSGSVLPPPADDYSNDSSASTGKPISKSATNNPAINVRGSPPNSSSDRSVGLPAGALWGTRASSNHPPSATIPSSNGSLKQKTDTNNGPVTFSAAVANTNPPMQTAKKQTSNVETIVARSTVESLESVKKYSDVDPWTTTSETSVMAIPPTTSAMKSQVPSESKDIDRFVDLAPNSTNTVDSIKAGGPRLDEEPNESGEGDILNLCSTVPSVSINGHHQLQEEYNEQFGEPIASQTAKKAADSADNVLVRKEESRAPSYEVEDDVVAFNNQRHKDPEVITDRSYLPPNMTNSFHLSNHSSGHSQHNDVEGSHSLNVHLQAVDNNVNSLVQGSNIPILSNGYLENQASRYDALGYNAEHLFPNDGKQKQAERFEREVASSTHDSVDTGESSIISNILSLDLDPWDEPLTSPRNLVKLLGEANNKQGSLVSSSRRVHNSNQSRFSFAREEEPTNQAPYVEPSLSYVGNASHTSHFSHDFPNDRSFQFDKFSTLNGFSLVNPDESELFGSTHSYSSSNKLPVSRSQISAPPGFSAPSRAPPPGFTSHERVEQSFDPFSGHHMLDTSSLLRDQFQASAAGNIVSNGDIEFMDPAILAVGKGRLPSSINSSGLDMRSNFSPQFSTFENEARLQSLIQRSGSPHQSQRFADMRETFTPLNTSYGIPNRVMDHAFTNNLSAFSQLNFPHSRNAVTSNGHWEGWSDAQSGNDLALAELLRNERLGFNKFYAGYEDSKFRMPSSGDIYNRTFGM